MTAARIFLSMYTLFDSARPRVYAANPVCASRFQAIPSEISRIASRQSTHAFSYPTHQCPVGKPLANHTLYNTTHHIHGVHISYAQPPGKLVHIPVQVLERYVMEYTVITAFEQRPERLDAVRMSFVPDVLSGLVVYDMVVG